MRLDVVKTAQELVRIPSVNPMGRDIQGPEFFEYRVTEYLENLFTQWGLPWERQPVAPLRDNILVRLNGDVPPEAGGPLLLWEVHQDTVPVDGMTIPPWEAAEREGRIWGRGSCDVKGSMAAMLAAFSRLKDERPKNMPTLVLACAVNEEHGFTGATRLCESWTKGNSKLLTRPPNAAIIAEPTKLEIVVAHKGVVRWQITARGRASHSSAPHRGENAIFKMACVLSALEKYQKEIVGTLGEHRLVGNPTLSVGTIAGGISVNTVPDYCRIEIDRRLVPGEAPETALAHVKNYLASLPDLPSGIEHAEPMIVSRGLPDTNNGPLADRLAAVLRQHGQSGAKIGVPFGTDASAISATGVPCVVFGPGSIEQAHTHDEWIDIAQLREAEEILHDLAIGYQ